MNVNLSPKKLKLVELQLEKLKKVKAKNKIDPEVNKLSTTLKHLFDCDVRVTVATKFPDSENCQVICFPVTFKQVNESDGYIYFMVIILGTKLLERMTARQLLAIFLHEYGHWYMNYKTAIPHMKTLTDAGTAIGTIGGGILLPPMLWPTLLVLAFITSTISSALSHKIEYGCDAIAVKYGYGPDLYSAFQELNKDEIKYQKKQSSISSFFSTLKDYLFGTSHPSFDDRMEKIIEILKKDHPEVFDSPDSKKLIKKYYGIQL